MKKSLTFILTLITCAAMQAADITVTQTAKQLATTFGWTSGGFYASFHLNNIITFQANQPDSGMVNGYYSPDSPPDWRIYQARNKGEFTVTARAGYKIRSLSFVYTNKNTGVLSLVPGTNIDQQYQVASGQTLSVDTNAITFYAGNTTTTTNGQVRLSQFTVTYYATDTTTDAFFTETFARCTKSQMTGTTYVVGDYGVYGWNIANFTRQSSDMVASKQGIRLHYGGSIAMNGPQEGGIRSLRFDCRRASLDQPVAFSVWVDGVEYAVSYPSAPAGDSLLTYTLSPLIDHNTAIRISLANQASPAQSEIIVGPISIAPYLLFRQHHDTVLLDSVTSYPLSPVLIDNTEGAITYAITSDETGQAYLQDGVVYLDRVTTTGRITIEAKWNTITTTLQLLALTQPTGLSQHQPSAIQPIKQLRHGRLLIQKDGVVYSVLGQTIQ